MIDIDVIGQLLPNPITMLTQLCSTLVLFLVIKKFLWKSITGMLDRRAEKMQEELTAICDRALQIEAQNEENGGDPVIRQNVEAILASAKELVD